MSDGNLSVEASILKKGKLVKGVLSIFADEYSFGSIRNDADWEKITVEEGRIKIKSFLRNSEKTYIVFKSEDGSSQQFIIEENSKKSILDSVKKFAESQRKTREEKEERERARIEAEQPHTIWNAKGDDFLYGRNGSVDYSQALYWYHKAADAGNMHSMNSIALCYQQGKGVPQNDEQAIEWFEKASEAGNPEGAYNLAECYYTGNGVGEDIDMALKYWAKAAKLGHPSAQERRDAVFITVQAKRRRHRARNHIYHDIGFQMTTGPSMVVEVTLNKAANVYLVNMQGYQNYLNGNEFSYHGGYASQSPYRIRIPSSNHWYVIVDNGYESISGIISSVKVKRA